MKFHRTFGQREQCVVFALSDAFSRPELVAALAHDDIARDHSLTAVLLNTEATTGRVATVTG